MKYVISFNLGGPSGLDFSQTEWIMAPCHFAISPFTLTSKIFHYYFLSKTLYYLTNNETIILFKILARYS